MPIKPSSRVSQVKPSATFTISAQAAELRAQGKDVLSLSAGEPDFDTPKHIKKAAMEAIVAGETKYTPVDGTPALKAAVIDKFIRDNQLEYQMNEILASSGAKQSLFNMLLAVINSGDEVIIPAPYWVSYPDMVKLADGIPMILNTGPEESFKIKPKQLQASINERSKLLILNSPSNPTGQCYSEQEWAGLGEVLLEYPRVLIVCDEIYEHIYWGQKPLKTLLNVCPGLKDRTLMINGVSKAYAMTGWRIGFAAGPAELIKAMRKVQGQSTSNPCSVSQAAAIAALNGPSDSMKGMSKAFHQRHNYLIPALNQLPGVNCFEAEGAFYAFPNFQDFIDSREDIRDDVELASWFLDEAGVALIPGTAFGAPGHLRFSFATSMENLESAIQRIASVMA